MARAPVGIYAHKQSSSIKRYTPYKKEKYNPISHLDASLPPPPLPTTTTLVHGQYGLYISNWPTLAWRQDNPRHLHDWRLSSASPPPSLNSGWWQPGCMVSEPWYTLMIREYILSGFAHNSSDSPLNVHVYDDGISGIPSFPLCKRYHTTPTLVWPCTCTYTYTHATELHDRVAIHPGRNPLGTRSAFPFWWLCFQQLCIFSLSCVVKTLFHTTSTSTTMFNCLLAKYFNDSRVFHYNLYFSGS